MVVLKNTRLDQWLKDKYNRKELTMKRHFSLVMRFFSIRLIPAIVANLDLELHQMDVNTTFLMENQINKSIQTTYRFQQERPETQSMQTFEVK